MPRNSTTWTLLGQKLMQHASFQAGFSWFFYFSLCVFRLQEWLGCKRLPFASSYTSRLWHILIFADLQIRTGLSIEQPWNDVLPCFTWTSFIIFCGVTSWRVMWNWMKLGCPFVIVMVSLWRSQETTSGLTLRARPAPHQSNPFQRPTAFWKFHVDFGWLRSTSYLL